MSALGGTGFNEFLGIELHGEEGDAYVLELQIGPHHLHDAGGVHGGVYLSLLDTVMARASRMALEPGQYLPTLELKMNFLGAIGQGRIRAVGRVISRTRRTCYVEGELVSDVGKLLARGSATMIALVARDEGGAP
ncbi:MAG: PaaI family thioesterase [Proteobacteria bacterium]|nr:PaaI family thioesterase [Pseudomonadota bacterium]